MLTRPTFTTLRVEGAILPPDLLQRVADGDLALEGLTQEAYHLDAGEKLNEAINRAWNRVLGAWTTFRDALTKLPEGDAGTTLTRERWLLPLFDELGYGRLQTTKAIEIEEGAGSSRPYPISHGWQNVPIHLVGAGVDLDKRTPGVAGAARNSPHSLVQVLLNRSDAHLWGFVSNGLRLRVLRDNVRLTRQAYVEFDLQAMMEGQVYSDFVLLWLVCHQSRVEASKPEECWLEKWSKAAAEQGTRALEQLRDGVEIAIEALGRGFLAHSSNGVLREKLKQRDLSAQDYYRQLLRLVYRLIFLFVAEDRDLLLIPIPKDPKTQEEIKRAAEIRIKRERYTHFYSTARLRELAMKRRGTGHNDLYRALRVVMEKLGDDAGCPELALTARGGDLFAPAFIADLNACEIANSDLLDAVRALAVTKDKFARRTVDFKNLGSIELGSVYESLLELHPILNMDAAQFELRTAAGNERKTTGSFYTPDALIDVLLDSALEPVLDAACMQPDAAQAILKLKVCDSAGGSGHIMIAAARRMARRLAAIRTGDEEPSPEAYRAALRDVITRCIYLVDINPMAVELAKVNLWMEMQDPRKPLSFLDAHIKCGNSLIGVAPGMDISEIPDEAFNAVTGDDKKAASALKKRNKTDRAGQTRLKFRESNEPYSVLLSAAEQMRALEQMPEENAEQLHAKQGAYADYVRSSEYERTKLEYDLWTAAFFWRIEPTNARDGDMLAPTHGELMKLRRGEPLHPELVRRVRELAERLHFFHLALEFPEVAEQGGFDANLSNPPWERIKLQEEEFFAARDPEIANAPNKAARQKLIDALPRENTSLAQEFEDAKHDAEATSKFVRESKRFPLTAVGDVNTYAIFTEHSRSLIAPRGRTGIIVPPGIATDDTTKEFFGSLMSGRNLVNMFGFVNEKMLFPSVLHNFRFALLTLSGSQSPIAQSDFAFNCQLVSDLKHTERHFTLSSNELRLLNPVSSTCPVFTSAKDAELVKAIHRRTPILHNEVTTENPWDIMFLAMFHMSNDSSFFQSDSLEGFLPLYESKMMQQFDHRYSSFESNKRLHMLPRTPLEKYQNPKFIITPSYYVPRQEVDSRLPESWRYKWLMVFRSVASGALERTFVATILPFCGVGNSAIVVIPNKSTPPLISCLLANFNSIVFDYVTKQKAAGANLNFFKVRQQPTLPTAAYTPADVEFIAPRVLELVYTAWDLQPFAQDMGYDGEPFRWDEERRAHLRAELDAYYARLYGLTRDELRYILDPKEVYGEDFPGETFRVLKDKEMKLYGEYRTRRLVLEKWDEMFT